MVQRFPFYFASRGWRYMSSICGMRWTDKSDPQLRSPLHSRTLCIVCHNTLFPWSSLKLSVIRATVPFCRFVPHGTTFIYISRRWLPTSLNVSDLFWPQWSCQGHSYLYFCPFLLHVTFGWWVLNDSLLSLICTVFMRWSNIFTWQWL